MATEGNISRDIGGRCSPRSADSVIADLAARQHGVVARAQLVAAGLGEDAIDHRIAGQRLHRIHTGVYAVGHVLRSPAGSWMAAVLACGEGAVLSHRSAGALWAIRRFAGRPEVTVPRRLRRPDITTHRTSLPPDEVTTEDNIPVTTPARTLFDLAGVLTRQQLEAAITEAEVRRLGSPTSLADVVARYPGRRGIAALRAILDADLIGRTLTRSELEIAFVALVDAHGLPRPDMNRTGDHGELDATWPAARLVVELDGYATHGTRRAFEADRARDRALLLAGWRVVRLTARQLTTDAARVGRELRILLGDTVSACPKP